MLSYLTVQYGTVYITVLDLKLNAKTNQNIEKFFFVFVLNRMPKNPIGHFFI